MLSQRSRTREKICVTTIELTGLARQSSINRAGLAKSATRTSKHIGLAQTAARIDKHIKLAGLATRSIKKESWAMENTANTESRITEILVNMENRVIQDLGARNQRRKRCCFKKRPAPRWCPRGITKTQKCRLQKISQRELAEKKEEDERDYWFNRLRPMSKLKQTWHKNG
jgi:hypothetical protein